MMNTDLLSHIVHELVVCTTKYFPVTGEGRMRDEEVARRVSISIPHFSVVDADTMSWGGLGAHIPATHTKITA